MHYGYTFGHTPNCNLQSILFNFNDMVGGSSSKVMCICLITKLVHILPIDVIDDYRPTRLVQQFTMMCNHPTNQYYRIQIGSMQIKFVSNMLYQMYSSIVIILLNSTCLSITISIFSQLKIAINSQNI